MTLNKFAKTLGLISLGSVLGGLFLTAPSVKADSDMAPVCPASGMPADGDCRKSPDHYEITIYEMGLCTTDPVNASYTTYDKSSCITTFTSGGTSANLANGNVVNLGGKVAPNPGTYTHAYLVMAPSFKLKGQQTTSAGIYSSNSAGVAVLNQSGGAKTFTEDMRSFDTEECSGYAYANMSGGFMKAMLLNSSMQSIGTNCGSTARIGTSFKPNAGIVITPQTKGLEVRFAVTNYGLSVYDQDAQGQLCGQDICGFGSGPFQPSFQTF